MPPSGSRDAPNLLLCAVSHCATFHTAATTSATMRRAAWGSSTAGGAPACEAVVVRRMLGGRGSLGRLARLPDAVGVLRELSPTASGQLSVSPAGSSALRLRSVDQCTSDGAAPPGPSARALQWHCGSGSAEQ